MFCVYSFLNLQYTYLFSLGNTDSLIYKLHRISYRAISSFVWLRAIINLEISWMYKIISYVDMNIVNKKTNVLNSGCKNVIKILHLMVGKYHKINTRTYLDNINFSKKYVQQENRDSLMKKRNAISW